MSHGKTTFAILEPPLYFLANLSSSAKAPPLMMTDGFWLSLATSKQESLSTERHMPERCLPVLCLF